MIESKHVGSHHEVNSADVHVLSRLYLFFQDQKGNQMYLGVTHLGIVTFQGNKRTHLFKW